MHNLLRRLSVSWNWLPLDAEQGPGTALDINFDFNIRRGHGKNFLCDFRKT